MKIIDAHIHFCQEPYFDQIAELAGHKNTSAHLKDQYAAHNIVHGVVMGNRSLHLIEHHYPDYLRETRGRWYCLATEC